MKNLIGGFFLTVTCACFGALLAVWGASMAGMSRSQWSLAPVIFLILGAIAAGCSFLLLLVVLSSKKEATVLGKAPVAYFGALVLAFLSGVGGIRISKHNERSNIEQYKEQATESDRKRDEFHALLRKDPDLAVREKWYVAEDERRDAYQHSLWQKDVAYSPEALASLYAVTDGRSPESLMAHILAQPSFSPEVLRKEYRRAILEMLDTGECWRLRVIIESPKFEQTWLEELDQTGLLDREEIRCAGFVREAIAKRFPNR
ncbi:MAG: hypothetical protein EOP88_22185 [Verrucomicrobiaceae bacterium]|nr:MAG: hypothetical protein EOP88_22185 [Verrucomicrobiaceae bacterium]